MFEEKTVREIEKFLHSDSEKGLSEAAAVTRLSADGKNELQQEKKKTALMTFLEQLNDPLIGILLIAACISFLLKEIGDAAIIIVVVLINTTVGVIQEGKAQKALDSLKKLTSPHALVRRGGKVREIPASQVVKGDLVILEAGMQVPADVRLTKSWNLSVEESALTGEAEAVGKDAKFLAYKPLQTAERKNEVFMSTLVVGGRGEGVVIATGMDTEIGKIASIIQEAPKEFTPLQKKLADLGKVLSAVSVLLCVALFVIAVMQHRDIPEMLITAISLAVAAVPEGLPAVVTIVLAMSVSRMVKVNTIIRRLPSVETLGSVNIVCSDKTGTLTQNKMTVLEGFVDGKRISFSEGKKGAAGIPEIFFQGFALCNDAVLEEKSLRENERKEHGDPTELALLHMVELCGVQREMMSRYYPRIAEKSFDSFRKMMTTCHQVENEGKRQDLRKIFSREVNYISYTKGAPDVVLNRCSQIYERGNVVSLSEGKRRDIRGMVKEMSARSLRVLALAVRISESGQRDKIKESDLIFVGLAGMKDPIRPEAKEAVEKFRSAGVRTVMITGDHADTAVAIAKELGIISRLVDAKDFGITNMLPIENRQERMQASERNFQCLTGEQLDRLSDTELRKRLPSVSVFARVSPEHKVRIVKQFKALGNVVAMTGDGVNDAPSLKMADIGIAMGKNGTDVAKNAADMILTDDNFATIEKAIEEGRGIYKNIRKTVLFLLSSNFGEIITMFAAILAGVASPLKASHILWINLITDSLPALALGIDKNDNEALMKVPPRGSEEGIFSNGGLTCTIFYGCLIAVISLTAFIQVPWNFLVQGGYSLSLVNFKAVLGNDLILAQAQTYAFTVLGMSQLFHAVGMRDIYTSVFSGKRSFNPLLAAAFLIGGLLQVVVTRIPFLVNLFGTVALRLDEWIMLMILSAFPILAHEVIVVLNPKKKYTDK